MQNIFGSQLHPTTARTALIAVISGGSVLALGFAAVPQLFYLLAAGILAVILTLATGQNVTKRSVEPPSALMMLVPAVLALVFRGSSLSWAVVPVLAFVVAAAAWMLVSNRYVEASVTQPAERETVDRVAQDAAPDDLAPKRQEKTAVTNNESSATAA